MGLKILIADDSLVARKIVIKAFEPYDCQMLEAANGAEALDVAKREMPGLIILDISMPVMDGVEAAGKLKADSTLKTIPIVMLTAESTGDNMMKLDAMKISGYLTKPFKGDQLIQKIKTVVALQPKPGV